MTREPKVLLLGWDAADWEVIDPLLRQGKMPALQQLLEGGVRGNLATLSPALSPMLWTSIATGKRASEHGICGFTEADPVTGRLQPVTQRHRQVRSLWNILNAADLTTHIVNWWPSHPAEKIKGIQVSNQWYRQPPAWGEPWPSTAGAVYPDVWHERLEECRVHPAELSLSMIEPFVPGAAGLYPEKEPVLKALLRIMGHCVSVHSATTLLMSETDWHFMAVYQEALDHTSHLTMKFHPPHLPGVTDRDFQLYHGIVEGMYRFHDMMLDRLLQLAGPDCHVLLVSDHGFESGRQRLAQLPDIPAAPALEHRPYGILAGRGPEWAEKTQIYGASLLDVVPSLLHLYRLPVGEDMPGQVMPGLFSEKRPVSQIPTWEQKRYEPLLLESDNFQGEKSLQQLEALGYIDLQKDDLLRHNVREWIYNKCLSMLEGRDYENVLREAQSEMEKGEDHRLAVVVAEALLRTSQLDKLRQWTEDWSGREPEAGVWHYYRGMEALARGDHGRALERFQALEEQGLESVQLWCEIARSFWVAGDVGAAREYYQKALTVQPEATAALSGLAEYHLEEGRPAESLRLLEQSLQLRFYQPHAHYLMARAAQRLNDTAIMRQALEICLRQAPRHAKAVRWWQVLEGQPTGKSQEAPVVVVSGWPRSGTSLMMAILEEAGWAALRDDERQADEHNPRGYYEYRPVKKLGVDQSWLPQARGKVLKVVAPLLRYLPAEETYRVIVMERPLTEVILSQEVMKGRQAEEVMRHFPFQMAADLEREEQRLTRWLEMQPHLRYCRISYLCCLTEPEAVARKLSTFLEHPIEAAAIRKVTDKNLHRQNLAKS